MTPSSRKMLPRTRTANPSASPVIDADMPSPTYFELQTPDVQPCPTSTDSHV